jgi:hypothetical protein
MGFLHYGQVTYFAHSVAKLVCCRTISDFELNLFKKYMYNVCGIRFFLVSRVTIKCEFMKI